MENGEQSGVWVSGTRDTGYGSGSRAGSSRKIRILIVDDHPEYRQGLFSILELESDMEAVGEASDGQEALAQVAQLKPHIVLMDVNMPGMDGMETTRRLVESYPDIGVIMLTMFTGEEHLRQARRAGASAYVLKDASSKVLVETIRSVVQGEMPLLHTQEPASSKTAEGTNQPYSASAGTGATLSANERTILQHLAAGLTNEQIGRGTGMSEIMVRTYLEEIYRKLGLSGRDAAIQYARRHRDEG